MRNLGLASLAGLLAACSGGDGLPGDPAPPHGDALAADLAATAARLADLDPTLALPTDATATYSGLMGLTADIAGAPPDLLTARMTLTARFGAGTIAGSFGEMQGRSLTVAGSGLFTEGTIGPAGVEARMTGTIAAGGRALTVAGDLRGAFLGTVAEGIGGTLTADVTEAGAPAGRLDGEFWAER